MTARAPKGRSEGYNASVYWRKITGAGVGDGASTTWVIWSSRLLVFSNMRFAGSHGDGRDEAFVMANDVL